MMFSRKWIVLASAVFVLSAAATSNYDSASAQQTTPTAKASSTPPPPISEESEVVKIDTDAVNVLFTAQDKDRRLLTNLKASDVRVLENGVPQEISAFSRQIDLPLSLAIVIDTSRSQERTLPEQRSAAIAFLDSVVRPTKDEVSIVSFAGDTTLEQGMTNNLTRLRRAVERVQYVPPAGYLGGGVISTPPTAPGSIVSASTAVWDAIWVTCEDVLGPAPDKTRRAIILLSDGDDTYSRKKLDEAVNAALKAEAVIYAIGIGDRYQFRVDESALRKLAERTGGRAYFPKEESDLISAFRQIQDEMRSQYLLAYEPTNPAKDGTYRTIEIELVNPQLQKDKIKLTHRQGYFAKNESKK
jgi:Ca-activated chloride channel family protein